MSGSERTSDANGTDLKRSSGSRTKAPPPLQPSCCLLSSTGGGIPRRREDAFLSLSLNIVRPVWLSNPYILISLHRLSAGRSPASDEVAIPIRAVSVLLVFSRHFFCRAFRMLGFHKRTRSLIPVKELAKYDVVPVEEEMYGYESEGEEELEKPDTDVSTTSSRQRQLLLVYFVFFAEA